MMLKKIISAATLAVSLAGVSATADARTVGGATFPDSMTVDGKTLVLSGAGKRVMFAIVDVYASALYLSQPATTVDAVLAEPDPKVLVTKYLHDASVAQTQQEYNLIYNRYCGANTCTPAGRASFEKVLAAVTASKVGQTTTYVLDNGTVTMSKDGQQVLTFHDPEYEHGMLASIVGPSSPTPGLRAGLLGQQ
jgi:hypothetical protein